jgi:hypothetical protein
MPDRRVHSGAPAHAPGRTDIGHAQSRRGPRYDMPPPLVVMILLPLNGGAQRSCRPVRRCRAKALRPRPTTGAVLLGDCSMRA